MIQIRAIFDPIAVNVVMLVGRVAVMVMVFAGAAVVMAARTVCSA